MTGCHGRLGVRVRRFPPPGPRVECPACGGDWPQASDCVRCGGVGWVTGPTPGAPGVAVASRPAEPVAHQA